jgi:hypothetical protein
MSRGPAGQRFLFIVPILFILFILSIVLILSECAGASLPPAEVQELQ